jgi:hypothetical protein
MSNSSSIRSGYFDRGRSLLGSIKWTTLRAVGKHRMVQSAYYWIIVVPILAKLLQNLTSPVQVSILGSTPVVNLSLPFSWYCFYFAAIAFALGSILYSMYCPLIIANFANFREYTDSGGEGFRLASEIRKAVPEGMIHDSPIWKAYLLAADSIDIDEAIEPHFQVSIGLRKIPITRLASVFYTIRSVVNHSHLGAARMTAFLFGSGFILLGIVLLQNINFVLIQLAGGVPLVHWPF